MVWKIKLTDEAKKNLAKLDKTASKNIIRYLRERIGASKNPRIYGKPLRGKLVGQHRYRVGDYRVICKIEDEEITVLVLRVGHRSRVYR